MNLRPFFSYFGSKWNIAANYYPRPNYGTIVEPFAGSASYAVRYFDRKVVLVDKSVEIVGIWSYLIKATAAEILLLPDLCGTNPISELKIPQEAKWLIGFWCQKARSKSVKKACGWSKRMPLSHELFWGPRVRRRLASQLPYIRHWRVKHGDFRHSEQSKKVTYFVDPPYQKEGHIYPHSGRNICYEALGLWCRNLAGQVIVCESAAAQWLPFSALTTVKSASGKRFNEGIWHNPGD